MYSVFYHLLWLYVCVCVYLQPIFFVYQCFLKMAICSRRNMLQQSPGYVDK
jgi:hypothetical protein